jgi:predicted nucleotidyltransferase
MKEALARFVESAAAATKLDSRLCGMAVSGSWASGGLDDFSDVDIILGPR